MTALKAYFVDKKNTVDHKTRKAGLFLMCVRTFSLMNVDASPRKY